MDFTKNKINELLSNIIIAKVIELKKHEDADRLQIVMLDGGNSESLDKYRNAEEPLIQVVTAANNFAVGDFVAYLPPTNIVPGWLITEGQEIKLESRKMRGEISHGMILAEDEIGIGEDHEGIMVLNSRIENSSSVIGESIVSFLTEDELKVIYKKAGIVEISEELQKKIDLILSIGDPEDGGEVVGADELPSILTSQKDLYTYDGFEPSGQMHIAQGVIRAINTNKMIDAGFTFRMWVADWFGYLNNKMGGDMEKIQNVGKYFIEIWKATGMNLDRTEFLWTSDFVGKKEYWETVMKVMKKTNLKRILRTTEIMGRSEKDDLTAAQVLYPAMQTTDIFKVMECQVTQLGMDQRKVNMLAREIGPELGFWKPVVVSHGMLQGLQKPVEKISKEIKFNVASHTVKEQTKPFNKVKAAFLSDIDLKGKMDFFADFDLPEIKGFKIEVHDSESSQIESFEISEGETITKWGITFHLKSYESKTMIVSYYEDPAAAKISMKMSKSKPETAIFMTDTEKDVERKINNAYCPEGELENNPIIAYCKQVIFQSHFLKRDIPVLENGEFVIERDEKFGGKIVFKSFDELVDAYKQGGDVLHPADLKKAVIKYINRLLEPVRKHFEEDEYARDLLEKVKSYQVTR